MPHSTLGRELVQGYKSIISTNHRFSESRPIGAYTVGRNLKSLLVKSKLSNTTRQQRQNLNTGYRKCTSNRCSLCNHHSQETNTIQSTSTKQTFQIQDKLTCTSKNIIYVITCKKCNVQYVGETGQMARNRFNHHNSTIRTNKQTPIGIHFNSIKHEQSDLVFTPVQQLVINTRSERLKAEKNWNKKLRTHYPWGLNSLPVAANNSNNK